MANKRLLSGPNQIINAEELFAQSVQRKEPDFRFVALAIGENPFRPPLWAMWACIEEREKTARQVASHFTSLSKVMDEMVRFFTREQFLRDDEPARRGAPLPSLRQAILVARDTVAANQTIMGGSQTEETFIRLMTRLWKREQEDDVVPSHFVLYDWKTTKRIDEIMHAMVAEELGHHPRPDEALWIADLAERGEGADK